MAGVKREDSVAGVVDTFETGVKAKLVGVFSAVVIGVESFVVELLLTGDQFSSSSLQLSLSGLGFSAIPRLALCDVLNGDGV